MANSYEIQYSFIWIYELMELVKPVNGKKILDIGCGTGELTNEIAKIVDSNTHILNAIGINSDPQMMLTVFKYKFYPQGFA